MATNQKKDKHDNRGFDAKGPEQQREATRKAGQAPRVNRGGGGGGQSQEAGEAGPGDLAPEKQGELASEGDKTAHDQDSEHEFSSEEADEVEEAAPKRRPENPYNL